MEYHAHSRVIREKTAKLKALRLAKEAAEKEVELVEKTAAGKV